MASSLMSRFIEAHQQADTDAILDCFWSDVYLISADLPPMTRDEYINRVGAAIRGIESIEYRVIFSDNSLISIWANVTVGGLHLRYYVTALSEVRGGVSKFRFIHFSQRPGSGPAPLGWIAQKLSEIEEIGLIRDINRLELQREIVRLEQENESLRQQLNRNYNLVATGRIVALNTSTNPPIFRITSYNINQSFLIPRLLLSEAGLRENMMVRVTESSPVQTRNRRETRLWMVEAIEQIEVSVDEAKS